MKIALDYDGTYTKDPDLWNAFIELCDKADHEVAIVTKRHNTQNERIIDDLGVSIFYMSRADKLRCPFKPDIWIDNNPFEITGYPK